MQPVPMRFVDKAHVLMSDGWVVRGAHAAVLLWSVLSSCVRACTFSDHALRFAAACNITNLTTLPRANFAKPRARISRCGSKLAVRRLHQPSDMSTRVEAWVEGDAGEVEIVSEEGDNVGRRGGCSAVGRDPNQHE